MRIPLASLLLLASIASGCASGPKYREVAERIPPVPEHMGRIYLFRTGTMFGAAIQPKVLLNGQMVGESVPGGFFFVDRPAGDYEVSCSSEVTRKVSFTLAEQETRYVETKPSFGVISGRIYPELVATDKGAKSLQDLKYTGAALPEPSTPKP